MRTCSPITRPFRWTVTRHLKAGQPVNFEIIQGPKGLHAINISPRHRDNRRTLRPAPQEEPQATPIEA